jgi:hypothetical protein
MYYIDPQKRAFVDLANSGQALGNELKPSFVYGEKVVLEAQFGTMVGTVWTPQAINVDDTWEFAGDINFSHADSLMLVSELTDIAITGAAEGIVAITIKTRTAGFLAKATGRKTETYLELKRTVAGGDSPEYFLYDTCYCSPSVKDEEGAPAEADPDYYTAAQVAALIAGLQSQINAKLANTATLGGTTYDIAATLDDGIPSLAFTPQE